MLETKQMIPLLSITCHAKKQNIRQTITVPIISAKDDLRPDSYFHLVFRVRFC